MRLPIATAFIFFGCLLNAAPADDLAPSEQDLHNLYGKAIMERFAVRNGITLTVQYGPDRKACQLLIVPDQPLVAIQSPGDPMSSQIVSDVLQQVVPEAVRGKQIIPTTTFQVGGKALLKTEYENVSIRRLCASQSCVSSGDNQDLQAVVVFKRGTCRGDDE